VINKADRGEAEAHAALYRTLGIPVFITVADGALRGLDELRTALAGQACVVAGQSGVGKSSLLNALHPGLGARTGIVAEAGHGRHTTNSSRSYLLPDGGRLIDTPGVRECAITGLTPLDVALFFSDIAALHPACHFADCSHIHEPDCAVRAAFDDGRLAASRYDSYCAILAQDLAS
jgi:ribosome biogenesis GTPase